MKRLLILATAIAMVGCGNTGHTGKGQSAADSCQATLNDTAAEAKAASQSVNEIYNDVFGWYTRAEKDVTMLGKMPDFDSIYTSADYKALLSKVKAADKTVEANGEIGFFDHDHWVCGQDFDGLQMKVVKVVATAPGKCTAEIDVTNCGATTQETLDMVFEDNQWKIDDFKTDGQSEKAQMREYVANKKQGPTH